MRQRFFRSTHFKICSFVAETRVEKLVHRPPTPVHLSQRDEGLGGGRVVAGVAPCDLSKPTQAATVDVVDLILTHRAHSSPHWRESANESRSLSSVQEFLCRQTHQYSHRSSRDHALAIHQPAVGCDVTPPTGAIKCFIAARVHRTHMTSVGCF